MRIVVAGILLSGSVLAILRLWWAGAFGPHWTAFEIEGTGCQVDLPGTPVVRASHPVVHRTLTTHSAMRHIPREEYSVGVFPHEDSDGDRAVQWASENVYDLEIASSESREVITSEYPTIESVYKLKSGNMAVVRTVAVAKSILVMTVQGESIATDSPNVKRFFGSLVVTDPATQTLHLAMQAEALKWREKLAQSYRESEALQDRENARKKTEAAGFKSAYTAFENNGPVPPAGDPKRIAGLKGHLTFDDPSAIQQKLHSPAHYTVPVRGGKGVRGTAFHFPTGALKYTAPADSFAVGFDKEFTFAFWLKSQTDCGHILSLVQTYRSGSDADFQKMGFKLLHWKGDMTAVIDPRPWWPTPEPPPDLVAKAPCQADFKWPTDNNWHHFAFTRTFTDGNGERVDFYVDAKKVATKMNKLRTNLSRIDRMAIGNVESVHDHPGRGGMFYGALDELCSFERALTIGEICTLSGSAPPK